MKACVIVLKCRGIIHNFPVLGALLFLSAFGPFAVQAGEKAAVTGKIKEVKPELKMVVIGLGSEHGLEENTVVFVYRDGEKIGAVRILNILSEHDSNGRIIEGQGLKVGDVVKELRVTSSGLRVPDSGITRNPQPATRNQQPADQQPATSGPVTSDPSAKPTEKTLAERVADLEKRVRELEKLLEATPPLSNDPVGLEAGGLELEDRNPESGTPSPKPQAPSPVAQSPKSGEFDKTVDSMLKEPKRNAAAASSSRQDAGDTDSPRKFIVTDKGLEAENPEGTPLITGKVLGPYNKNKEIGIFLGKDHEAKRGYIFFIYRGSGEELKLVAKIKVEDVLADTVGGPILIQYDVVRETDRASTRMPEAE